MRGLFKNRFTTLSLSLAAMLVLAACGSSDNGGGEPVDDPVSLSINVVGEGSVSVEANGDPVEFTEDGTFSFEEGTEIGLLATPAGDNAFAGFVVDGAECGEADGPLECSFTLTEDTVVTASFGSTTGNSFEAADTVEELIDAEDVNYDAGYVYRGSGDLDFGYDFRFGSQNAVGLYFDEPAIPEGAIVTSATLRFVPAAEDEDVRFGEYTEGDISVTVALEVNGDEFTVVDEATGELTDRVAAASNTVTGVISELGEEDTHYELDVSGLFTAAGALNEVGSLVFIIEPQGEEQVVLRANNNEPVELVLEWIDDSADDGEAGTA